MDALKLWLRRKAELAGQRLSMPYGWYWCVLGALVGAAMGGFISLFHDADRLIPSIVLVYCVVAAAAMFTFAEAKGIKLSGPWMQAREAIAANKAAFFLMSVAMVVVLCAMLVGFSGLPLAGAAWIVAVFVLFCGAVLIAEEVGECPNCMGKLPRFETPCPSCGWVPNGLCPKCGAPREDDDAMCGVGCLNCAKLAEAKA